MWYRAEVRVSGRGNGGSPSGGTAFEEERAVGFRVRDESGTIRVFPAGARFDVPTAFDGRTGMLGDPPPGLHLRTGPATTSALPLDREAEIARLLTVRAPETAGFGRSLDALGLPARGDRRYEEARLAPGDLVTVVGTARPFGHLEDPDGMDHLDRVGDPLAGLRDPVVADSIAAARAAGLLVTPEEAWGNAAIPGFGIGRPERPPELDPGVAQPELAAPSQVAAAARTFDLAPDVLVIATAPDAGLHVAAGTPTLAAGREEGRFLLGLLGAALAIASAVALALTLAAGSSAAG